MFLALSDSRHVPRRNSSGMYSRYYSFPILEFDNRYVTVTLASSYPKLARRRLFFDFRDNCDKHDLIALYCHLHVQTARCDCLLRSLLNAFDAETTVCVQNKNIKCIYLYTPCSCVRGRTVVVFAVEFKIRISFFRSVGFGRSEIRNGRTRFVRSLTVVMFKINLPFRILHEMRILWHRPKTDRKPSVYIFQPLFKSSLVPLFYFLVLNVIVYEWFFCVSSTYVPDLKSASYT